MSTSKLFLIILSIFVGLFCAVCGTTGDETNRIINGKSAYRGQFPYQVSVRLVNGRHLCSGAILNNRWIITNGRCVYGFSPAMVVLLAALHYRSKPDGVPYLIDRIEVHNEFQLERLLNDIALIRVKFPFMFVTPFIWPIALPRRDTTTAGVRVIVSGWGFVRVFPIYF